MGTEYEKEEEKAKKDHIFDTIPFCNVTFKGGIIEAGDNQPMVVNAS